MITGLVAGADMADQSAAVYTARANHLAEVQEVGELYTAEDLARAQASVAAGLAVALRARAEAEDARVTETAAWWRRVWAWMGN